MRGNKNRCHVVALVGFMFLMAAKPMAQLVNVDLDTSLSLEVNVRGTVSKCEKKAKVVWKTPETCQIYLTNLKNGTWLTDENTNSSSKKPTPEIQPATTPTKPRITDFWIPTDLYPLHYEIEIFPNMTNPEPKNFTFTGYVKIWMTSKNATDKLILHSKNLIVDPNSIIFTGGPTVISHKNDTDREFLILQLDTNTTRGQNYSVQMNFTSPLKDNLEGLYYSQYTRNNKTVYLATTQFQPHYARRVFPCFDEPAIKATFDITLVRPSNYISLSNMPDIAHTPIQIDGVDYVKDTFEKTPKMSTYLLALVICDFVKMENTTENGVLFRVWSSPEVLNKTKYSFDIGFSVFSYFEKFFNVKYPLPKLDMAAIPTHKAGGMENWGLILNKEMYMMEESSSRGTVAVVVNHEIAHQWFGDLVSPALWDFIWLNEGFATFVGHLGIDYYHPEWKTFESFVQEHNLVALESDSFLSSHPLSAFNVHPDELTSIFDILSYLKGAAVLRMMRHFLGFETFTKGLTLYLTRHEYSAATQDDLWSALAEQARLENKNIDVKEVMDTWTLQMNFPLVTVTLDNSYHGALRIEQERFLFDSNEKEIGRFVSPFNYTWNIPLNFASNHTRNFNESDIPIYWLWRNETSKLINASELLPSKNTWFICNINMNGYYRVNYDRSNWLALAKQLKEDHEVISVINRVQIINDAWTFAKKNILPYDTVFSIMDYLKSERHKLPWMQAKDEFNSISKKLLSSPINGKYEKFMRKIFSDLYDDLEEKKKSSNLSESEKDLHFHMNTLACKYGDQRCLDNMVAQYKRWMDNPKNNTIPNKFKNLVYCTAISRGGEEEWNFLLKMYKDKEVGIYQVLNGLSCTNKPWILKSFLQMSIDENAPFPKDMMEFILYNTPGSPLGTMLAWDFFRENFKKLKERYESSFYWAYIINEVTESFDTELRLNELKAFKREQEGNFGSGEAAMLQAIQKVESNVQWMSNHYNTIADWLNANVKE